MEDLPLQRETCVSLVVWISHWNLLFKFRYSIMVFGIRTYHGAIQHSFTNYRKRGPMEFTSGLPHAVEIENGEITFLYYERKIKKITREELKLIETLKPRMNIRIIVPGVGPLTPEEYLEGGYELDTPDPTLAGTTLANYKSQLRTVLTQAQLEDDPEKKAALYRKAERYHNALGIRRKFTSPLQYTKAETERRTRELAEESLKLKPMPTPTEDEQQIIDALPKGEQEPPKEEPPQESQ